MVINLLFIVVVLWDYKICYGMWKTYTISVIANIEGAVDFICGDGQSFYQVKSIIKKTNVLKTTPNMGRLDRQSVTFSVLI